jgi:hypothetical protein
MKSASACIALLLLCAASAAVADEMVVIKNAKVGNAKLSKAELREVFTGKTKLWANGKVVQVALGGEGSPDLGWLAGSIFGVGESALITKIKQEVFKGEMKKPLSCAGDDECIAQVKGNEGGVAIVSAAAAGKLPAGVVVLSIE